MPTNDPSISIEKWENVLLILKSTARVTLIYSSMEATTKSGEKISQNLYRVVEEIIKSSLMYFVIFFKRFFQLLFYYSCSNFSLLPSSAHPTIHSHSQSHTVGCVHQSFIHVLCLVPSPSFHYYPLPLSFLVTVSLFHVSLSLVPFFLLV